MLRETGRRPLIYFVAWCRSSFQENAPQVARLTGLSCQSVPALLVLIPPVPTSSRASSAPFR